MTISLSPLIAPTPKPIINEHAELVQRRLVHICRQLDIYQEHLHEYNTMSAYLFPYADEQQLFLKPFQSINLPTTLLDIESTITTDASEFIKNTQDEASAQLTTQLTDENNLTIKAEPEKLIEVNKINKQAANQPFAFDLQKDDLANPLFSFNEICIISQQAQHNLVEKQQLPSENIDSFAVSSLPNKLNAAGIHTGQEPYLIADDALLLKDINQRLGWSREFKPLFHFGWRQIGITEQKAIPLKLMAGKHVEHYYQQALEQLEQDFKEAENIEQNLLEQLATNQNMIQANNKVDSEYFNQNTEEKLYLDVDEKSQRKIAQKQQALMQLLADLNVINNKPISSESINEIVSSIENQTLDTIIHDNPSADTETPLNYTPHLTKPIQPWFLEGFIKVHLDHYLYITADLNVFNQNDVTKVIENNKADKIKLVNFSQNRRVITGEIHYFDHPYIGMIVQIRRFDPSKPKGEQVSQAIK